MRCERMSTPPTRKSASAPFVLSPPPPASAHADTATINRSDDVQIDEIVGRLRRRYPDEQISGPDLRSRVCGFYGQFDTARVRNFVMILVESLVRRSYEAPPAEPDEEYRGRLSSAPVLLY
jgi:hypothetical protein